MRQQLSQLLLLHWLKQAEDEDGHEDFDYDDSDQKSPGRDKSLQPTFFLHSFDCNLVMGGEHFLKVLKVNFF